MPTPLTARDILSDIEFEILQGTLSRSELGKSVLEIKHFQNKVRGETFQSLKASLGSRELISRQFQITDMLLTLLQEMASTIQSLEWERKKLALLPRVASRLADSSATDAVATRTDEPLEWRAADGPLGERHQEEVEAAMRPEAIQIDLQVSPLNVPVIGWLIQLVRVYLHRVSLFYIHCLVNKQVPVNQTFGDWILQLSQLAQTQHEQIKTLNAQLEILQARVVKLEASRDIENGNSPDNEDRD